MIHTQRLAIVTAAMLLCASVVTAQSTEELMNDGQALLQNGAFSQAVTNFRQVVAREPDNFEAQFNLGFAYLQWGRMSNALDEFKKAQRLQPRNSQVFSNLAIIYENTGKKQEAIDALYQAVSIDPGNVTARMNLAAMYGNADRNKEAVTEYRQVLKIEPSNEEALTNLSKCLIATGQVEEAKSTLKEALAANPNDGVAHWELGNIYREKEKSLDKAVAEYKTAVSVQPDDPSLYENLASALNEQGKKDEAIETLKKSMVYITDALQKDKVQQKIDKLEAVSAAKTEDAADTPAVNTANQIQDLQKELGRDTKTTETKQVETTPPVNDIQSDINDLSTDTTVNVDLKSEAKKRAGSK